MNNCVNLACGDITSNFKGFYICVEHSAMDDTMYSIKKRTRDENMFGFKSA